MVERTHTWCDRRRSHGFPHIRRLVELADTPGDIPARLDVLREDVQSELVVENQQPHFGFRQAIPHHRHDILPVIITEFIKEVLVVDEHPPHDLLLAEPITQRLHLRFDLRVGLQSIRVLVFQKIDGLEERCGVATVLRGKPEEREALVSGSRTNTTVVGRTDTLETDHSVIHVELGVEPLRVRHDGPSDEGLLSLHRIPVTSLSFLHGGRWDLLGGFDLLSYLMHDGFVRDLRDAGVDVALRSVEHADHEEENRGVDHSDDSRMRLGGADGEQDPRVSCCSDVVDGGGNSEKDRKVRTEGDTVEKAVKVNAVDERSGEHDPLRERALVQRDLPKGLTQGGTEDGPQENETNQRGREGQPQTLTDANDAPDPQSHPRTLENHREEEVGDRVADPRENSESTETHTETPQSGYARMDDDELQVTSHNDSILSFSHHVSGRREQEHKAEDQTHDHEPLRDSERGLPIFLGFPAI